MCPKSQKWMGGGSRGRWGVTLQRGDDYSCIHSVFNQWIKLSIYSSIDVSYDKCLSMLSRQGPRHRRPFNHWSRRWGEVEKAHGSGELDLCRVFNYPAAAAVHIEDDEGWEGCWGSGVNRWNSEKQVASPQLLDSVTPPPTFAMALSQYGFAPLWSPAFWTTTIVNGRGAPITGLHASPWNYSGVGIWVALSFICDLHFYIFQYQGGY